VEVTHELAQVRPDGLPSSDYNESLAELDAQIIEALEDQGLGITVVIETYNGQRSYYAYVTSVAHAKRAFDTVSGVFHNTCSCFILAQTHSGACIQNTASGFDGKHDNTTNIRLTRRFTRPPTACAPPRSSAPLRLPAAGELGRSGAARSLVACGRSENGNYEGHDTDSLSRVLG